MARRVFVLNFSSSSGRLDVASGLYLVSPGARNARQIVVVVYRDARAVVVYMQQLDETESTFRLDKERQLNSYTLARGTRKSRD